MLPLIAFLLLIAPPVHAEDVSQPPSITWEATIERVVPAVVAIRVTGTRDFDTEDARHSVGTGFVVDAEQGLILTNRHMVHAGPVIAEAVFLDHEEVEIRAVYRDPVHDFGFYRFDPSDVRFMEVVALELAPEAAQVGREIRVIGNDAGEKISILDGTLARLDRSAPDYGGNTYNDFNTFYLQAASGTSGGSSGSPVVDIEGRAIALNAGGRREAASSYYLPLDRVVRALDRVRSGDPVPRGTLQTVFLHQPYDEVRRLGLRAESERGLREAFPDGTGALVVSEVVPGGPGAHVLEPGDVLIRVEGTLVNHFVPLEARLDDLLGGAIVLDLERGGEPVQVTLPVQDLHDITPDEYLEVSRGVLNPLSYQQARNHVVPVKGVYLAAAGYMFGRAGVPAGAVITAIDGDAIEDLDALQQALEARAGQQRMIVRYHTLDDPRRDQVTVAIMDRLWFPMKRCVRDDTTGNWPCTSAGPPPAVATRPQVETVPLTSADRVGRKLASALVLVEFDIPHPTAGVKAFNYVGSGVIVDAERGWVLVDRDTVPVALGDIDIVFAGSLRLPGRVLYLHPTHNIAVLNYEPALLGDTPVGEVTFDETPLQTNDVVWQVGLDRNFGVVSSRTRVERVEPLFLGISGTPRYRDYNLDGVDLVNIAPSLGGVLTDRRGRVRALWASFVDQREEDRRFRGLPASFLPRAVVEGRGALGPYCATGAEVFPINLADAQDRGLSIGRSRALVAHDPIGRRVLEVQRVVGGSNVQKAGLRTGDLLLEATVGNDVRIITRMPELESLSRAACGDTPAEWTVLRDGEEVVLPFSATPLDGHGTNRAISWAGLLVHEPHPEVALQQGMAPDGVYVTWLWYGSPAARYDLRPTRRITEVDGIPTPNLDAFMEAVRQHEDRQAVRLKTVSLDGQVRVYTLKLDQHYWPMYTLDRDEDGVWTRK